MSLHAALKPCSSRKHSKPPALDGPDHYQEAVDDDLACTAPALRDPSHQSIARSLNAALAAEDCFIRQEEAESYERYSQRTLRKRALEYAHEIEDRHDLAAFDRQRFLDPTEFDFRFRHRHHLSPWLRTRFEYVAAKLMHRKSDGDWGYFRTLVENGIDYKSEIGVLASIPGRWAESVCKCGIWTKGYGKRENSGRCHHHEFCRLCSWMDYGRLLMQSYGARTGTFSRAMGVGQRFFAIHLSVRDHPENARAVGRDLHDEDLKFLKSEGGLYSEFYASRPVVLGGTSGEDDIPGLRTCQFVSLACMESLRVVYRRNLVRGIKAKLETALQLVPTRALPHLHGLCTADIAIEPQFLAEELKQQMDAILQAHAGELQIPLFASVRVFAINSPEHLERAAVYIEKPIPVGDLVKDALNRDEARNAAGELDERFLEDLEHGLANLQDQVESISHGFKAYDPAFHSLRTRLSLGNLVFGKKTTLPTEPQWHRVNRIRHAKVEAKRRAEKRKRKQDEIQPPNPKRRSGRKGRPSRSTTKLKSARLNNVVAQKPAEANAKKDEHRGAERPRSEDGTIRISAAKSSTNSPGPMTASAIERTSGITGNSGKPAARAAKDSEPSVPGKRRSVSSDLKAAIISAKPKKSPAASAMSVNDNHRSLIAPELDDAGIQVGSPGATQPVLQSQDQIMNPNYRPDPTPHPQSCTEDEPVERITLPPDQDQTGPSCRDEHRSPHSMLATAPHQKPDPRPRGIRVPPPPFSQTDAAARAKPEPYTGPKGIRVPPPPRLPDSEIIEEDKIEEPERILVPVEPKSEPRSQSFSDVISQRLRSIGVVPIKIKPVDPATLPPSPEQHIERRERVHALRPQQVDSRLSAKNNSRTP